MLSVVLKSKTKSGLITSLGLFLFFFYGHIYLQLDELQKEDLSHFFLLIPLLILFGFGTYYFIRTKRLLDNATFIVNIVSISLVLISFVSIVEFYMTENYVNETIEESIKNPIQVANAENLPDIYYIIPDGYAGSKSLELFNNYDNSEFIDFLTNKGFYVSSESFSNYKPTKLSLSSTLAMKYVNYLGDVKEENSKGGILLRKVLENSEVIQYLKSKGYTIFSIEGNPISTKNSELVDFHLCGPGKYASDFDLMLIRTTILQPIYVELFSGNVREHKLCGFSELINTSELDYKPKFVLAHIMIPHTPYVFGPNGEPVITKDLSLDGKKNYELYLDQLQFVNKKIQEVVEKLVVKEPSPIIIIQSDHGIRGGPYKGAGENGKYIRDFNNFKAYYFPDKGRNIEFETTTPVNSFRVLFNLYFDEHYEILEDKIYDNAEGTYFNLTDITDFLIKKRN